MFRTMNSTPLRKRFFAYGFCAALLLIFNASVTRADNLTFDPANDFIASYAGPAGGDLDVISGQVALTSTRLIFTATLNANIGTTQGAFYVWGIDRGAGTPRFGVFTTPQGTYDASGVLFDSVVLFRPGGASAVTDLISGVSTPITAADISVNGATINISVPLALLPSRGFSVNGYTWNLWPRFGGTFNGVTVTGNSQISDFAPNNSNAVVTSVPEPTTLLLLGSGIFGFVAKSKRCRVARTQN